MDSLPIRRRIFDLLDGRILDNDGDPNDGLGQDGNGVDGFKGYNVLHYAIMIPVSEFPSFTYTGALQPESKGIGVYASVSRPRVTLRSSTGNDTSKGPWIQVNRLANPLFNEVLVALADKDNYNRTKPTEDAVEVLHLRAQSGNRRAHQYRLWNGIPNG